MSVLLLEAGGPDTAPEIHIPAMFPIMFKSGLDWDLTGDEEPGLDGRRLYLPRGRMIGGCSSINAMIYLRGNRLDYDDWAANGADGWSYDEVLPYFKRGEDNERGERRVPRSRRPADRFRQPLDAPARRPDARGCGAGRARGERRPERCAAGRRRPLPADAARRLPLQHGRRVSPPGAGPAEPRGARLRLRRADRVRRKARRRRRARRAGAARDGPRRARGDPLRRRLSVTGAADALRHRAARGAGAGRNRGPRGAAGRPQPPGPLRWRTSTTSATCRRCSGSSRRRTSRSCTRRAAGRSARTCPRPAASSARARTCLRPTSSSTSRRRSSTTRA